MIVFVVPVHGRRLLATACLRQLARTCLVLDATAVLVGAERYFEALASELGFGWVPAVNNPLGRKWNDGVEHACRTLDADHVVLLGSDDVVIPELFDTLPGPETIRSSRLSAVVSPDGRQLAELEITYKGGDGVRVFPRGLLAKVGFRPANDHTDRAIDGSVQDTLFGVSGRKPRFVYHDLQPLQILDFKSNTADQRNSFASCLTDPSRVVVRALRSDFWDEIAAIYGTAFVSDVREVYGQAKAAA